MRSAPSRGPAVPRKRGTPSAILPHARRTGGGRKPDRQIPRVACPISRVTCPERELATRAVPRRRWSEPRLLRSYPDCHWVRSARFTRSRPGSRPWRQSRRVGTAHRRQPVIGGRCPPYAGANRALPVRSVCYILSRLPLGSFRTIHSIAAGFTAVAAEVIQIAIGFVSHVSRDPDEAPGHYGKVDETHPKPHWVRFAQSADPAPTPGDDHTNNVISLNSHWVRFAQSFDSVLPPDH
jgi:hypothetical protein